MSDPAEAPAPPGDTSAEERQAARKTRSRMWLALWIVLTAGLCYGLATAWPHVRQWSELLLLFTLAGAIFRGLEIAHLGGSGAPPAGKERWAMRAVACMLGGVLAAAAWHGLDLLSMVRFERAMAPLMAQMHTHAASPCPTADKYSPPPETVAYLNSHGARGMPGNILYDDKRFVMWTRGGSIDIDGSTIWYDSATRRWSKFHNDERGSRGEFDALIKTLNDCATLMRKPSP